MGRWSGPGRTCGVFTTTTGAVENNNIIKCASKRTEHESARGATQYANLAAHK